MDAPISTPDGSAEVITRRTKPVRARSLLGARDSTKAGMPMVNHAAMVTWIGWNGYSSGSPPNTWAASPARPTSNASSTE